jgi:hypothetical protein
MSPAPAVTSRRLRPAYFEAPGAKIAGLGALGAVGLLSLVQIARVGRRASAGPRGRRDPHRQDARAGYASAETRALHGAAALLALSVLADSAVEHYRGSFENPGMYAPLITSALTLIAGTSGGLGRSERRARHARAGVYATAAAVGAVGTGFHLYNLLRRPGGFSWLNLFYAAPIGAPAALSIAGLLGLASDRLEAAPSDQPPKMFGLPADRTLAGLTALGLAGTVGEAGLMHFRGAFQNPFMFAPITAPPIAAALMLTATFAPRPRRAPWLTRCWLGLTAMLGFAGVGFHAFGVSRAMGGWRNWSQNLVDGPPLPAPPSFAALSLAALAALSLLEKAHD